MKHIFFPTDFSVAANNALPYAKALATEYGAALHIVHTYHASMPTGVDMQPVADVALNEVIFEEATKNANALVESLTAEGFTANTTVTYGFLKDVLTDLTTEHPDSIVVCATTGASGAIARFLGTNASAIIDHSNVPVLVVPQTAAFDGFKSIVYAASLQDTHSDALRYTLTMARVLDSALTFLKIDTGLDVRVEDEGYVQFLIKEEFADKVPSIVHYRADSVKEGLLRYSEDKEPSLLVMVRVERSFIEKLFLPSQTRGMVMVSPVPLLILHNQKHSA